MGNNQTNKGISVKNKRGKMALKIILACIALVVNMVAISICFATPWLKSSFEEVSLEEILFTINMPLNGTNTDYLSEVIQIIILPSIATVLGAVLILYFMAKYLHKDKWIKWIIGTETVIMVIISTVLLNSFLHIDDFFKRSSKYSVLIENEYVDPETVKLTFPEKKRNLIYIYLESMEASFEGRKNGGLTKENVIPELTELSRKYTNFSTTGGTGGFYCVTGADYTSASLTAQTMGIPLKFLHEPGSGFAEKVFLPGAVSIGELLRKNGYENYFAIGSDAVFGGRKVLFQTHGDYTIFDYNSAIRDGEIDKDYKVWWGYEDEKLFEFSKKRLKKIAKSSQPFNYTMLTVDTHWPEGYVCDKCNKKYDMQYKNVLACSSKQVAEFVEWIQKQDFYQNTTIVICGDHVTMEKQILSQDREQRRVYNTIINEAVKREHEKKRQFTAMDMFPTTLAALGVKIDGERLGMGVNLYSGEKTVCERYGYKKLDEELGSRSVYYNKRFLKNKD